MKVAVVLVCVFAALAVVNGSSEGSDEKSNKKSRSGVAIKAKETKATKASSSAKAERQTTVVVKEPPKKACATNVCHAPSQHTVVHQQVPQVQHQVIHQQAVPQQVVHHQLVPQFHHQIHYSPSHVTHLNVGIPHAHLDVVPMSTGAFAIPVDDVDGQLMNYIHIGEGINLVPHVVNGVQQHLLPCVDQITGHQTLVHLGSANGHLKVVEAAIDGHIIQGIHGYDNLGEVIIPVTYQGSQMTVVPTVHRVNTVVHQPAVAHKTVTTHHFSAPIQAHSQAHSYVY